MKGLLIKDFNLLKKRGIFLLVIIVGYAVLQMFAGGGEESEVSVGFATLLVGVFSLTTITYDEYENGMPFIFTLPISRKDYVREKYAFAFIVTTSAWIIMSVAYFVFEKLIWTEASGNLLEKLAFCVSYLLVTNFLLALQIALKLKFSERSGIVMFVIGASVGAPMALFYAKFGISSGSFGLNMKVAAAIAAVVLLILMYVFYRWSVRIMEKKEF